MSTETTVAAAALTYEARVALISDAFRRHGTYLRQYASTFVGESDADDVVSELAVVVMRRFKDDQLNALPLLRIKCRQLAIDHLRKRQRRRVDIYNEDCPAQSLRTVGELASSTPDLEADLYLRFWSEFPLPERTDGEKRALFLYARNGLNIVEVADALNISRSTAFDWISRTRRSLAELLKQGVP